MSLLSRLLYRQESAARWIEPEDLSASMKSNTRPLVVDVRGPDEFAGPLGHIDGAINVPLPELATRIESLARNSGPLVVVCKTDRRSSAAAEHLRAAGAADVSILRGGMERWRELGLP